LPFALLREICVAASKRQDAKNSLMIFCAFALLLFAREADRPMRNLTASRQAWVKGIFAALRLRVRLSSRVDRNEISRQAAKA
jgi:hypothetical protein